MSIIQQSTTQLPIEQYRFKLGARNFVISPKMILRAILLLSITLRLFSALFQGNNVSDLPGIYDQISYDGLARRVVEGFGFSFAEGHWPATRAGEPTAHWSYLYTIYLVAVYKIFGFYPIIARVIQAVITGLFQTLFTWRIARRIFGERVGFIAAMISAIYIYFFYYAGALITESFYIVCILWTFDVAFRIIDKIEGTPGSRLWLSWLELGLAISFTVLFRQLFLLFLPFLFLWIWWNSPYKQTKDVSDQPPWKNHVRWPAIKGLTIVTLVLALIITPWTIRNYRAFGTFVLLNTNAGFAFYWGNHPIYGTKFIPLLSQSYQDLIPPNLLVLNEGKLDQALLREGIKIVLNDPVRYVLLSFSRTEEYFKFLPSRDSSLISNISRVGSFGIFLPFMITGIWISLSFFRNPVFSKKRAYLLILYLFIIIYTAIHLMSWTLIRYRLPVDAFLIIFAAVAFHSLNENIGQRLRMKTQSQPTRWT